MAAVFEGGDRWCGARCMRCRIHGWTHFNTDSSGESGLWEKPFCKGVSLEEIQTCMVFVFSYMCFFRFTNQASGNVATEDFELTELVHV